jgi:hypothetical protein
MKQLGIITARKRNWEGTVSDVYCLIKKELDSDPSRNRGPDYVNERLRKKGIHLPMLVLIFFNLLNYIFSKFSLQRYHHNGNA